MMSKIDSVSPKRYLYADIGNSSIKLVLYTGSNWSNVKKFDKDKLPDLRKWIDDVKHEVKEVVLSSVRNDQSSAFKQSLSGLPIFEIRTQDIPPKYLSYETPETLGIDRYLSCLGARSESKGAVVVIDAGTALTMDYMGNDDVYHGGLIAPGIAAFSGALQQHAPELPNVEFDQPSVWPGKSTIDSMKWGQAGFYKMALEQCIHRFRKHFGEFELYTTGGDGDRIKKLLDGQPKYDQMLVFKGMKQFHKLSQ